MPRKILVATASLRGDGGPRTIDMNLKAAERLLDRAAAMKPDIVCLPETFPTIGVTVPKALEVAEPVPGPTVDRIGALARRHGMYIVCPLLERRGDRVYNAGVLIDRQGRVAGVYHKVHPTIGELESGVTPGQRVEVFETDFGRVSVLICFDVMSPERWREAKALGAEVLFWPSAYEGGLPLQSRASDHEVYVVSCAPVWGCHILDITGYPLASTGQRLDIASARIDLEKRLFSTDYNMSKYHAILAKYGQRVSFGVLSPEGSFTLESHDPAVTVADLVGEFGLETQQDYFARSARAQEAARPD
ncbi:MAG: carbon-nitrogen hydrolase family protein [Candidatus Latescibacteria bacterium]|nr:carbon-nitrogen hydrolase family protein [Candidatus Latescibacterota bacterium]